jgi:hypothetical protein
VVAGEVIGHMGLMTLDHAVELVDFFIVLHVESHVSSW